MVTAPPLWLHRLGLLLSLSLSVFVVFFLLLFMSLHRTKKNKTKMTLYF